MNSLFLNIYLDSFTSSQSTMRRYLFECFMSLHFSSRTPRLAFLFTWPHFVFLFCGHVKYFSFNGK